MAGYWRSPDAPRILAPDAVGSRHRKDPLNMTTIEPLAQFTVPLGGQQIELQSIAFDTGGTDFLRIRIREGKRFTVFDIDPATAGEWAAAMAGWVQSRGAGAA